MQNFTQSRKHSRYDPLYIESANGLSEDSVDNYRGKTTLTGGSADPDKYLFNAGSLSNLVTVKKAGVVAVCYCQFAATSACDKDYYWVMAARFTVKGPFEQIATNNLEPWEFSTNVVFRIEYRGYGIC